MRDPDRPIRTGRKGITIRNAILSMCSGCGRRIEPGEPVTMVEPIGWVCDGCDRVDAL